MASYSNAIIFCFTIDIQEFNRYTNK